MSSSAKASDSARIVVPRDTEEARLFLAERISLFGAVMFWISIGFFVLSNLIGSFRPYYNVRVILAHPSSRWHMAATLLSGLVWAMAKRVPLSDEELKWLDGLGVVAVFSAFVLMGSNMRGVVPERFDLVLALIYMLILMTRAIIVPSTAARSALIGICNAPALLAVAYMLAVDMERDANYGTALFVTLNDGLWCLTAIAPSTFASHVIYGLREQVREAFQLGQYTLSERIGEGGMGTVYLARHALLRRPTAIKLLSPDRAGGQSLARFEREVQLTSMLTHPNTVAIYDYGHTADGVFYYAMEYLDGFDLQRVVDLEGPQNPARVVHVLSQVCGALAEAHGIGLVHRDIKPANIILCQRGGLFDVAKVVDFGLVKDLAQNDVAMDLSATHAIVGTPAFLSPEAIRSPGTVDARSDLYGCGAVMYFMLTGAPVFEAQTTVEICGHHLHTVPVPPSARVGREIPKELENLVLRCLAKDPTQRPQSATELREALQCLELPLWSDAQAHASWMNIDKARVRARPFDRTTPAFSPALLTVDVQERKRRPLS